MKIWQLLCFGGAALLLAGALLLLPRDERSRRLSREDTAALLLLLTGLWLRAVYAAYTPVTLRQHDVYSIAAGKGHAGYIDWFFRNLRLPDFSPTAKSQFYHPPLHHFLAGMWMRLQAALFHTEPVQALENVQYLTVLYSALCPVALWRLLKSLRLHGAALLLPLALFCCWPGLFFMAGDINNDALMNLLMLSAFTAAVEWYLRPGFGRITLIALFLGLGMMSKLSAVLAAPAIALLFLAKLSETKRRKRAPLIGQFALFALIVFPLGLWWPFYGLLRYGVPLAYVPTLPDNSTQYIGSFSLFRRLIALGAEEFRSPFIAWKDQFGHLYNEHNILVGLFKTSLFDETTLFRPDIAEGEAYVRARMGLALCRAESFAALALGAVMLGCACVLPGKNRPALREESLPLLSTAVLGATVLLSYISFCLGYPHVCTMNFRYAVPCLFAGLALLGEAMERVPFLKRKGVRIGLIALGTLFCLLAFGLVCLLGK